jgi:hypothetical protein
MIFCLLLLLIEADGTQVPSKVDLWNLCKVSRLFYHQVSPKLYENLFLSPEKNGVRVSLDEALSDAIFHRENHLKEVKSLQIAGFDRGTTFPPKIYDFWPEDDAEVCVKRTIQLLFGLREGFLQRFR